MNLRCMNFLDWTVLDIHRSATTTLPLIDLSSLNDPSLRSQTIESIRIACKEIGFFQVINHGISPFVAKDAVDTAMEFFGLSEEEKMSHASDDIFKPVRYVINGTNHLQRSLLKLYSHPISKWIHLWPANPPNYREKMGKYVAAVQVLQKLLMGIVMESLGLNPSYLQEEIEEGMQALIVNFYPLCPDKSKLSLLGSAPHSDHGLLTILLQTCPGLQLKNNDGEWIKVPFSEGALLVFVGDQLEVLSNGIYKSVIHQATGNAEESRISIASIISFALEGKVRPAPMLVDEDHPCSYQESSFREFLDFISSDGKRQGRFIDTLKKNPTVRDA